MSFNNIKIVHKLAASFVLITLLVIGLVSFSYLNLSKTQYLFGTYKGVADESLSTGQLLISFMEGRIAVQGFRRSGEAAKAEEAMKILNSLNEKEKTLAEDIDDPERDKIAVNLSKKSDDYLENFSKTVEIDKKMT